MVPREIFEMGLRRLGEVLEEVERERLKGGIGQGGRSLAPKI